MITFAFLSLLFLAFKKHLVGESRAREKKMAVADGASGPHSSL